MVHGPVSFSIGSHRGASCFCQSSISHELLLQLEEEAKPGPKHKRDIHIYFHGGCAPNDSEGSYGYRMRAFIVNGIQQLKLRGASVSCTSDRRGAHDPDHTMLCSCNVLPVLGRLRLCSCPRLA